MLPSSVADNVFWLGRYVERAECIARIVRSMISRVRRAKPTPNSRCLIRLHGCLESRQSKLPRAEEAHSHCTQFEQELISLITDVKRADSLASTLVGGGARRRQRAGAPVGRYGIPHRPTARTRSKVDPHTPFLEYPAMLTGCLELLSAFSGMERENINRGLGWLFMSIGRRLERAIYLTRQLREITTPLGEQDWPLLECLLEVADSSMTYRSRYYTTLQPLAVLDVLMADETNPRSLDFQLTHLVHLYRQLPRHVPDDLNAMQNALALLRSFDLRNMTYPLPGAASAASPSGWPAFERFLEAWKCCFLPGPINLSSRYFSHARTLPITVGL